MASTIKTAIRVRPLLKHERGEGHSNSKLVFNPEKAQVTLTDTTLQKTFRCDHLIPPEASQDQAFAECHLQQFVQKVLEGYNSTIFAYGQTGSGKSYTMHGGEEGQVGGITGRVAKLLFQKIGEQKGTARHSVSISFLQIYSERIYDLLNSSSLNNRALSFGQGVEGLRLRWNKDEQFTVENLFLFDCGNENDLLKHVVTGLKNRITASHKLNLQSSRSHSILSIKVETVDGSATRNSRIDLVDLAGSERIGLTKTEGRQAKESIDINKSLFTLRQVINILSENSGSTKRKEQKVYVPYRDSKLTSILKQSIGGNAYCMMIACLTPADSYFEENLSTLTYVTKASFITNNPVLNLDQNSKQILELRKQLKQVSSQLVQANKHIELLNQLKESPHRNQNSSLNARVHRKEELEMNMPSPSFGKKISDNAKMDYNSNISERLIQSINMVRELLKSNKDLREKLEEAQFTIQDRNTEVFQLTQQNQLLRENGQTITQNPLLPTSQMQRKDKPALRDLSDYRYEEKGLSSQGQARRQSLKMPTPISRPPTQDIKMRAQPMTTINAKPSSQDKTLDMSKLYLNEKGVDSAPTNFNKRSTSTSQNQRDAFSRGGSQEMDRNAITAKFNRRSWLIRDADPKCFLSFYEGSREEKVN